MAAILKVWRQSMRIYVKNIQETVSGVSATRQTHQTTLVNRPSTGRQLKLQDEWISAFLGFK